MAKMIHSIFLSCCLLMNMQCDQTQGSLSARAPNQSWPDLSELYGQLRETGKITLVYGTQHEKYAGRYRQLGTQLAGEAYRRLSIEASPDTDISAEDLQTRIILAIGTPESNSIVDQLADRLPVNLSRGELRFDGHHFDDPSTIFSLGMYPNPYNRKLPVLMITGLSDEAVLQQLSQIRDRRRSIWRWNSWGYAVYQNGQSILLGAFDDNDWSPDPELAFDFTAKDELLHTSEHYRFWARHARPDPTVVARLVRRSEQAAESIAAFCGKSAESEKIDHYLYASAEDKGLILHNTDRAHVDFEQASVHTVVNDIYRDNYSGAENTLLLRQLIGAPSTALLEKGLALRFTEGWQEKGYGFWAQRLYKAGSLLPLAELLDNEGLERNSELLTACLAASFVDYLIHTYGRETFLNNYRSWTPLEGEIPRLEAEWHQYLLAKGAKAVVESQYAPLPYLRGFTLAHEGYQIYNGYASRMARRAIAQLDDLHVNAVAIVPYSGMRDPTQPSFIPVSDRPGSENDESVIHAVYAARDQGMLPMLKPQIWLGGGSWPGDIEMQNEEDWKQWFDFYGRWIIHYAMLAEIHEVPLFCIGTEFSKASIQRPADWKRLIERIRKIYTGPITYAANWGEEFENLTFWEDLDYIGLNCYYPLHPDSSATKAELLEGHRDIARRVKAVVDREQKPMLLTEIGFSSVRAPWVNPHLDGYDRPYSEEHQELCYEVVLEQLSKQTDWCRGIFWWKWPTETDYRGRDGGKGFTPNGKAAAEVVKKYYAQLKAAK